SGSGFRPGSPASAASKRSGRGPGSGSGYGRADRVDRDQDCHLAIERPSQEVSSNGVIDKAADAGRDPADEEHEVLPDQPARAEAREARPGPRRWGASVLGQRFALQVAAGDRLRTLGTCEAILAGL